MPPGTRELPLPVGPPDIPRLLEIGRRNGLELLLPGQPDHSHVPFPWLGA
jgi:hypothetical protein